MAIKAFRLDLTPERAAEFAVELEDLATSQPRHPGMAAALAAGVEGTTPYLAQEYVAGEALDAALRQFGPPPAAETVTTLRRVADALDRAAGDNIHHGMLHPRDILIAEGGDARVIDLGVAQALARCGLRVPVRRPYSAPERVADEIWSGAADIFSLGAIAYELLTGRRLAGPGRPDPQVAGLTASGSERIADVLARALETDPAARFPSAADLVDALAPLLPNGGRPARKRSRPVSDLAVPLPLDAGDIESAPAEIFPQPDIDAFAEPLVTAAAELPEIEIERVTPAIVEPGAAHDFGFEADTPVPRFASLDDGVSTPEPQAPEPEAVAPAPEPPIEAAEPMPTWQPMVLGQPAPERRPLLPLVMALVVGIAGGFGWGYWTAYRTLTRPFDGTAAAEPATAAPPESVKVEEPEVIGERGLPSPAETPRESPRSAPPAVPPAAAPRSEPPAEQRRPAPQPSSGRLTVRSTPAGARVLVDGRARGRTPIVLRDLPLRAVRVRVERDGYKPDERRIALTAAQPNATVEARLAAAAPAAAEAPAAKTGTLQIESRPSGATIFVDGRQVGTTPMSLPDITPGTHRIRLELAGFNPWVTTSEVQAGARARVAASLERGTPE